MRIRKLFSEKWNFPANTRRVTPGSVDGVEQIFWPIDQVCRVVEGNICCFYWTNICWLCWTNILTKLSKFAERSMERCVPDEFDLEAAPTWQRGGSTCQCPSYKVDSFFLHCLFSMKTQILNESYFWGRRTWVAFSLERLDKKTFTSHHSISAHSLEDRVTNGW